MGTEAACIGQNLSFLCKSSVYLKWGFVKRLTTIDIFPVVDQPTVRKKLNSVQIGRLTASLTWDKNEVGCSLFKTAPIEK